MKINTQIRAKFVQTDGKRLPLVVEGVLTAPDRPLRGEHILWPYADKKVVMEDILSGGCELLVDSSGWVTISPGKIVPYMILVCERELGSLCQVESFFMGSRLLLAGGLVKFPYASGQVDLPKEIKDFPIQMTQKMRGE